MVWIFIGLFLVAAGSFFTMRSIDADLLLSAIVCGLSAIVYLLINVVEELMKIRKELERTRRGR